MNPENEAARPPTRADAPNVSDSQSLTDGPSPVNSIQSLNGTLTPERAALQERIFNGLAALPLPDYDRKREEAARILGVQVTTLDAEVERRRPSSNTNSGHSTGPSFKDPELWPDPVDGGTVLVQVAEMFERYVVLPTGAASAMALWVALTHIFKSFDIVPRLNISSPDKQCGKSLLLDIIALVVSRPLQTENLTVAVLFRLIQAHAPTILLDECDAWLRESEELRGLLNAGHRRGGQALRCVGDDHQVQAFDVFAPVVFSGIGNLPNTLEDRSIKIRLERAKRSERRERFDSRKTIREKELCRMLTRWCSDNRARIESCDPKLPEAAFNRVADNWRPLFAIAEVAGGDWPQRAATAFESLTGERETDAQPLGITLLADIRRVFQDERLFSYGLCCRLNELQGQPWSDYGRKSDGLTQAQLARLLKPFKIHSRNIKAPDGQVLKGYYREDFQDAFDRYLPPEGDSNRYPATEAANIGDSSLFKTATETNGSGSQNTVLISKDGPGSGVADENAGRPTNVSNSEHDP